MTLRNALVAVVAVGLMTTSGSSNQAQTFGTNIVPVETPAGPDSAQPQLTVSARGVLLSWIERNGGLAALKFSERKGAGSAGWPLPALGIMKKN